jgi:hypothetical protein
VPCSHQQPINQCPHQPQQQRRLHQRRAGGRSRLVVRGGWVPAADRQQQGRQRRLECHRPVGCCVAAAAAVGAPHPSHPVGRGAGHVPGAAAAPSVLAARLLTPATNWPPTVSIYQSSAARPGHVHELSVGFAINSTICCLTLQLVPCSCFDQAYSCL